MYEYSYEVGMTLGEAWFLLQYHYGIAESQVRSGDIVDLYDIPYLHGCYNKPCETVFLVSEHSYEVPWYLNIKDCSIHVPE